MTATLILGNHLSGHGDTPKVCEELAARLRAAGWPVLTASHRRRSLARLIEMSAAPALRRRDYAVAQIDVYSGRAFLWAEAAAAALTLSAKPFVVTLHGGALPEFFLRHPRRVRRLLRAAAAVTAPSSYLSEALGEARPDIEVLPNAIDLPRYRPRDPRAPLGARLIWLRAFHDLYNSILAVETLAELHREDPHLRLAMIGPDRGDGSLARARTRVAELGLASSVSIRPGVAKPEVPEHLAAADLFVNTSRTDNMPVSVIEAMACGLPIVSTDVGGIGRLLEHEVDALLVPAGSPAAMAQAMAQAVRRIRREPGLAARLSQNARRKAESFDWGQVLPRWQELLTSVAQGSGQNQGRGRGR